MPDWTRRIAMENTTEFLKFTTAVVALMAALITLNNAQTKQHSKIPKDDATTKKHGVRYDKIWGHFIYLFTTFLILYYMIDSKTQVSRSDVAIIAFMLLIHVRSEKYLETL